MIEGFEDYIGLMIVSPKADTIEKGLIEEVKIGITTYKGEIGYGTRGIKDQNKIIHTVINRIDMRRTYNLIDKIDPKAFIIEFDVNNVKGGILNKYLTKKTLKKKIKL